ncbi:MAG: patatin-like phospholipase family protein [Erysipelotrichales bacterium]|nr:MAG: patatin-like phospholipase family protein [Erysipelotrichales bacterium]
MKRKLGLALSGGGIKAYAQIGVLRVLEEKKLGIDMVAGTSMGSIIASLLAAGASASVLLICMLELEKHFIAKQVFLRPNLRVLPFARNKLNGFIDADVFEKIVQEQLDKFNVTHLSDLKMPIAITAVDLITGKLVLFTNVPEGFRSQNEMIIVSDITIAEAVCASCSFPIVFSTKKIGAMQLVDGGVKMNLPVPPLLMMGANKILSITMDDEDNFDESSRMSDIAIRIVGLMARDSHVSGKLQSDYNLNVDLSHIAIFDVGKGERAVELGFVEAHLQWKEIAAAMTMKTMLGTIKDEIDKRM